MLKAILKRILGMIPVLIIVSFIAFGLVHLVPGDPAATLAGEDAGPEQIRAVAERLHLNDPLVSQYWRWASGAIRGDFGESLMGGLPVGSLLKAKFPVTISLAAGAMVVAVILGSIVGTLAAARRGRMLDRVLSILVSAAVAVPPFWLALELIIVFALDRQWFPAVGWVYFGDDKGEWFHHLILPSIALGLGPAAEIARQLRGALIDALGQDFVRTARAKGVRRVPVLMKHAMKNAAIPAVTVMGIQFSFLVGGAVIAEQIFGIPGVGSLAIQAVFSRDIPIVQAVVMVSAVVVMVTNLLVDISYGFLNPKVRMA